MLLGSVQCVSRLLSVGWFLMAMLHNLGAVTSAVEKGQEEIRIADSPVQLVIGGSSELKVFGNDLTLRSVEILPPEGITVSDIREITPDAEDARQQAKGVKVWAFRVSIAKGTQPGKRSIILISQKGRTVPQEVRVCTHLPKISDLTLLSASPSSATVKFLVFDEAGDITPQSPPDTSLIAICLPKFISSRVSPAGNVVAKDEKNTLVETTYSATVPNTLSENCELRITITDKEGYESNRLKIKIKFK